MERRRHGTLLPSLCLVLALAGCRSLETPEESDYEPASVEEIEGSELARVILTEDAARRIGLETSRVTRRGDGTAVPESAIWVDVDGTAWVYTERQPLVFVRARVVVDRYQDGSAHLAEGPPPGTVVASIGVPELIGSELGI
jgi:hypothetical protein